jgi:hypothetical protein
MISAPSVEHPKLIMNRGAKLGNNAEMCKRRQWFSGKEKLFSKNSGYENIATLPDR